MKGRRRALRAAQARLAAGGVSALVTKSAGGGVEDWTAVLSLLADMHQEGQAAGRRGAKADQRKARKREKRIAAEVARAETILAKTARLDRQIAGLGGVKHINKVLRSQQGRSEMRPLTPLQALENVFAVNGFHPPAPGGHIGLPPAEGHEG